MQQPEHAALALAHGVRKRFEQRPLQRDPVGRRVHFVLGKLELAVADIFIGEKFYFLEADNLRTYEYVAVRMRDSEETAEPAEVSVASSTRTCV